LMGSALAIQEKTTLVSNTPTDYATLIRELRETASELRVRQRLQAWSDSIRTLPPHGLKLFKWLLLVLNTEQKTIGVTGYSNRNDAAQELAKIEKNKSPEIDAVLVWVNSIKGLRAAYPNYYADTKQFLDVLDSTLSGNR
jgi:hypothetical protein